MIEAEKFVYYLLLTLVGWTVALALQALRKHTSRLNSALGQMLWKVPMTASMVLGFISWVTLVEFLHAREPFFTGIPAAMMYVGWMVYLTVHVYKLAEPGQGPHPSASA